MTKRLLQSSACAAVDQALHAPLQLVRALLPTAAHIIQFCTPATAKLTARVRCRAGPRPVYKEYQACKTQAQRHRKAHKTTACCRRAAC